MKEDDHSIITINMEKEHRHAIMGFLPYTDAEMQRERREEEAMVKSRRNKKRDELAQCHLGHLLIQHSIDSGLTSAQS
jgi:uncharacterized protein YqjF (DUF2071 family)